MFAFIDFKEIFGFWHNEVESFLLLQNFIYMICFVS